MSKSPPEATAETRRLAAIMFTDIAGFSRQMGANEASTLRLLAVHNQVVEQAIAAHHGHVIKTFGDAFLVDFPSVVHAVQCAQRIQAQFRVHNAEQDKADQIHIRIGIHLGDIVVQPNGDVLGDGVNIASRLQTLAEPDTICISHKVYEEVEKKLALGTVISLGRPKLKNITPRFQIYALLPEQPRGLRETLRIQRLKLSRRVRPAHQVVVAGLVLVAATIIAVRYFSLPTLSTQPVAPGTQAVLAALPLPDKPSIVVFPFVNMSKDPDQEYFSDGLTEVLTADLSRISSLFVIARNTAFTYKGKATNVQDVGRELGVRYVLEGSVQKADNQVRIVAQLIDATTGGHLWIERYDRPLKDIFALQDEIVQKIVTTLKLQLTVWEQGYSVRKRTDNLEAYDAFLRGMEFIVRNTKEAVAQARQLWEKSVALDPQYAEAYAFLGYTYFVEWARRYSVDPQTLEQASALGQQAVALDDSLPIAHSILSLVYAQKRQYDQALAEGERAIALDPNNADSYMGQANVLIVAGRPEDAIKMMAQAMRLNPHSQPMYAFQLGWAYSFVGRYDEAITTMKEVLSRSPNYLPSYLTLAGSYLQQWAFQLSPDSQTLAQALAAVQQALTVNDSDPLSHQLLGLIYLWQKQYDQAIAEGERVIALDPNLANGYTGLAEVLSRVGRSEEALRMVEQALRRKPFIPDGHLNSVGTAYYLAGRPEEAIAPLKQYLARYPNILGAHLTLAAVYSELGREAEARAEAAEVLRLNPQFSLEVHEERVPIKDPAVLERYLAALRRAGLK
ncbi:MAG: tetratricopeptide repeat protein [Deltaproteobacteria bacterium]|nr:tetratricopeptide repeat protein [Deltaproteobacteria bacterium]